MKLAFTLLAALAASGCALMPDGLQRRTALASQISDDAVAFNDAYGRAVSSQILLNVMRGRDRLPRYYLSMTGISDAPSLRNRQTGGIGGVPLGEGGSPWGFGNAQIERETQSRPSYAVQPFDAGTLTRTAFEPIHTQVFAHYWHSGWPRDLLLLLMVERIDKTDGDGNVAVFTNEANTIFENCPERVDTNGCDFVRELRDFLITVDDPPPENGIDLTHGRAVCGLIEAYGPSTPVRPIDPPQGRSCDPVFPVGQTQLTLRLRSLDDIIYYVGELLRAGSMNAGEGAIEAQVLVRAAGLRGGGQGVPLFRVVPANAAPDGAYSAAIEYANARYVAGPAIGRSCAAATPDGPCRDDAEHGDRSSSVLSLIAELMALNQSPEAIRAPGRFLAE